MLRQVWAVARQEWKLLINSWIFIAGLICVGGVPVILDSPLSDGHLWIPTSSAYSYNHGAVTVGMMFVPLMIAAVYYKDQISGMPTIVFSQPVSSHVYALGKFFGTYLAFITMAVIGNLFYFLMPIVFGKIPYGLQGFIQAMALYTIPSMFFLMAFVYAIDVVFNKKVITIFLPIVLFLLGEEGIQPQFYYRITEEKLATLAAGKQLPQQLIHYLILNRSFLLGAGVICLIVAVITFSPKKLYKGGGCS